MMVDATVVPGLLLLALELLALAAVGYIVARVALRQSSQSLALAQGLVIGPALWGLAVNFILHLMPGRPGALAGWAVVLLLGAALAWRAPSALRLAPRTLAGFAAVTLAIFVVALAARQSLIIHDAFLHLGMARPVQEGVWPPVLPWSPWQPVPYHYGAVLLVALLQPPAGPDLAFTTELLDAWGWMALAVLIGTALLRRGGWTGLLTLLPLLLTAGAWTPLTETPPALLHVSIPAGLPEAGLRVSLAEIYWPTLEWPWERPELNAAPPNIWFARFTLSYALAFTVVERATTEPRPRRWFTGLILAALVGFLGLLEEAVALTVLGLWGLVEVARFVQARRLGGEALHEAGNAIVGLAVSALLLAFGGGVLSGMLGGSAAGSLTIEWMPDTAPLRPTWSFDSRPGGIALLGLGPAVLIAGALLLAGRDRLVVTLAAGGAVFLLASIVLHPDIAWPTDTRLDGHAGNFALLALLAAAASRLCKVGRRWRVVGGAVVVALVVWPTAALPIRTLGEQVSRGISLANAQHDEAAPRLYVAGIGRQPIERLTPDQVTNYLPDYPLPLHARPSGALASDRVVGYIRSQTPPDARIFSPHPSELTLAAGRPNASGFADHVHLVWRTGPSYQDVLDFLWPAAIRRLGFGYLHVTDAWLDQLPDRAHRWLRDPRLFDLLVREGAHALYRVRPAFLALDPEPPPESFEALRRAVPSSATINLAGALHLSSKARLAAALAHARVIDDLKKPVIHSVTGVLTRPRGIHVPNVLVVPRGMGVYARTQELSPVWWNDHVAVYSPDGAVKPLMDPPPRPPRNFAVRVSDVHLQGDRITFTAEFTNRADGRWRGQDWLVAAVDASPWAFPYQFEIDGRHKGRQWYAGQITPDQDSVSHRYLFDPRAGRLSLSDERGNLVPTAASGEALGPGMWTLAVRLRHEWHEAAFIPVMKIVVDEMGDVSYDVYEGQLNARLAR